MDHQNMDQIFFNATPFDSTVMVELTLRGQRTSITNIGREARWNVDEFVM